MRIVKAEVEWHHGYANLIIHVEDQPSADDFEFEERNGLFYAECNGMVRFYAYKKPGDGFGGHTFNIRMKDGTERALKGPWSSHAGAMNRFGFGPCVDVVLVGKYRTFGAVTLEVAQEAAKLAGVTLKCTEPYGPGDDITWEIAEPKPEGERKVNETCYPAY